MNFIENLKNYIRARYSLILIKTDEEDRLTTDLINVAKEMNHGIVSWSIASGLVQNGKVLDIATVELKKALDVCEGVAKDGTPVIFVFYDVLSVLNSQNGMIYQRRLKEFALHIRQKGYRCNCILVSSTSEVSGSIRSEITVLDYPLPTRDEVYRQIQKFTNEYKDQPNVYIDDSHNTIMALSNAALGLTHAEISNCLSRALVEDHRLDINDVKGILNEKKQIIRKSEILEYVENKLNAQDIGGLSVLKSWLNLRGKTFSEHAKAFGLQPPKGVLLVGIPGCGKSLTAKCISGAWRMPLLKLDMGKIFGKYVGDSESNIRKALKTAEAIAPCVLWIDEIEKGLSGNGGDGGTATRVFGTILTWMQDKTSSVFTFATANNIKNLPPELLRKGRFDEIFFVDLPDYSERKKILEIHINKTRRSSTKFDINRLAWLSGEDNLGPDVRLSGAEIESWVKDALLEAYSRVTKGEKDADLSMNDFEVVLQRMVPMAKMRFEDFKVLREWADQNAVSASVRANAVDKNPSVSLGGRKLDLM